MFLETVNKILNDISLLLRVLFYNNTKMHSSRMRTACSSSRLRGGGGVCLSACWEPPRVWTWTPPGQTPQPPLGLGLDTPPPCEQND